MARVAPHYADQCAVFKFDPHIVAQLRALPFRMRNSCVRDAVALAEHHAQAAYVLCEGENHLMRVGPLVSIYEEDIGATNHFVIDNFLGVDGSARHLGPNKVIINLGREQISYDVVLNSRQTCFDALRKNLNAEQLMRFLEPSCEVAEEVLGANKQMVRYQLAPHQALLLPSDTMFYRPFSSGKVFILHGFFRAIE